jgi:tRNA (cytidine/uridine-2'-O-)-methyltransferase
MNTPNLNVVLFQPQIPPNTGNIGRSCVALNSRLHVVEPIGFDLSEKAVRRAGLDYWQHLDLKVWPDWSALETILPRPRTWCFSRFATRPYTEIEYQKGDFLVFGSETDGLPQAIHDGYADNMVTLPMVGPVRSLNLSVTAGIAMFEAFRQIGDFAHSALASDAPTGLSEQSSAEPSNKVANRETR